MGGPAINGTTSSRSLVLSAVVRYAIHSLKDSNLFSTGARAPAATWRRLVVVSPATSLSGSPLPMPNQCVMLVMAIRRTRDILSDREVVPVWPPLVISYKWMGKTSLWQTPTPVQVRAFVPPVSLASVSSVAMDSTAQQIML